MRLGAVPQSLVEFLGLASGAVPTPLMDTVVALLLARTLMAATALGLFDALEDGALSAEAISVRCVPMRLQPNDCFERYTAADILSWSRTITAWRLWLVDGCCVRDPSRCMRRFSTAASTCAL